MITVTCKSIFITTFLTLFLSACTGSQKYYEVYVKECDVPYKVVNDETTELPKLTYVEVRNNFLIYGFIYTLIPTLTTVDSTARQQAYYREFKRSCAEKGITITEMPTERRIYLNKKQLTANKQNSDSELSDIER